MYCPVNGTVQVNIERFYLFKQADRDLRSRTSLKITLKKNRVQRS